MSLVPDPETAYAHGRKHGMEGNDSMPENYKFKIAYGKGFFDGRTYANKIRCVMEDSHIRTNPTAHEENKNG